MTPTTVDEARRRAAIDALDLGTLRGSDALNHIVDFAARLCDVPIALVSVVEEDCQSFLARTGLEDETTPREQSFCAHAMLGDRAMLVPDATADPRFATNPLVTERGIRFYAGFPLVTDDGIPIGALCVIDTSPRDGLTALQRDGLAVLAENVMARLRDSRDRSAHRAAERHARRVAIDSEQRFRVLADTMPQMVWSTLPDGYHDYYNARWYEFTGAPAGTTDGEGWNDMFHADDQDRAWALWRRSLESGDPYEIEYRLRHHDGTYRWVLGRALPMRDRDGRITRWFGTCTDIHEQRLAMEEREIISQELSHRIKNIFSVVAGLIQFAARANPAIATVATDLRQRITALGRAHDFVRPHSPNSRPHAQQDSLHGLLVELFAPYQAVPGERISITGPDVAIDDRAATPLALLFHELATNASKYGALSTQAGHVDIAVAVVDRDVAIRWTERGGPPVSAPVGEGGFGSKLVELSAVRQLGGRLDRAWHEGGLELTCTAPLAAFSRSPAS
ncbi:histidine kinase [Sphingomonas sp. Leaf412]|uniref:sensor histidine kinase n=1 Tax=Sphingomonas sp. Leaf412 TaxID=1736370 RepID=UPI0006F911E1|nr:PAS domain-containing protein [Sphingomonas sp. Leaf412]KQT35044.1 histidine kinase [Sphingomonas sp. Leaf412]